MAETLSSVIECDTKSVAGNLTTHFEDLIMSTKILRHFLKSTLLLAIAVSAYAQQNNASLRGRVSDELNASIVGASITITDANGKAKVTVSNSEGIYVFAGMAPGTYTLRAEAKGFARTDDQVELKTGPGVSLDLTLKVTVVEENVTIAGETPVSTEIRGNANQTVLGGRELAALPDDPDELAAVLQALAGPTAGPTGGQIVVDGFSGAALPSKSAIREVRINQNPFAAENDQPAARIDVLTRPGTDTLKVSSYFNFNDESLNSRNPFTSDRQSFQVRQFGGSLSGTLAKNKASFFLDAERREMDDNELITATILNANLNPVVIGEGALTPRRFININPRVDYAINNFNTLVGRYTFSHSQLTNTGVGGFSLLERAYNSNFASHTLQLTETAIINPTVINETRFQFIRARNESFGDSSTPAVLVSGAFFGGSSQVGNAVNTDQRWEVSNFTAWQHKAHAYKFGARARGVNIDTRDPANFGGQFSFTGALVPLLDANNNIVTTLDPSTQTQVPVPVFVSSLERYRRTLLFQQQSKPAAQIRALGGGAAQFSVNTGNPEASVSQYDFSVYGQDEWRMRPNLTVSYGLRYEYQTNIHSPLNFAPRLAIAWSPGATANGQLPKTVIRFGGGVFYNRLAETNTLRANRFNGTNEQQFILKEDALFQCQSVAVINPAAACLTGSGANGQLVYTPPTTTTALDSFPNRGSITGAALTRLATWRVAPDLRTMTIYAAGAQIERQLPYKFTMFAGVFILQLQHVLRARDLNTPLPGTITAANPNGVLPLGNVGHVYQVESSGRFSQQQYFVGFNNRFNRRLTFFSNYSFGFSKNDTDGLDSSFAPNPYNLSGEYGRGSFDLRHRFTFVGNWSSPYWGLTFSPFILATSGAPFNIITGEDTNLDGVAVERPAFAPAGVTCNGPTKPANIICTRFGNFNIAPAPGEPLIPRNFGTSPAFLNVNLTVSKTITFGTVHAAAAGAGAAKAGAPAAGQNAEAKRYTMQFSLSFNNLLNHTNLRPLEGNLSSPYFGQSLGLNGFAGFGTPSGAGGGNRRIVGRVRFSF
jgi:hypothetical protein